MKKIQSLSIWMVAILLTSLVACDKDPVQPIDPPPTGTYNFEEGAARQANFFGEIVDENDQPVSGAAITIGSSTATTNSDGLFFVENAMVKTNHAYIKAEKDGFFLGSRSIVPQDGTNKVKIMLLQKTNIGSFDASAGGTLSGDGVSIDFAAGVVDASGNAYTGMVNVAANYIDPEGENLAFEMPGNLIGADADGGKYLETYGMVAVELTDNSGNELQLADGSPAEITFPLSTGLMTDAPATIPLWSFDEGRGFWEYEGEATLVGNTYVASVSHFSFWNCDIPTDYTNIEGRVIDTAGVGLGDVQIRIVSTGFGTGYGFTNDDGYYGGIIPANVPLTLEVYVDCGTDYQFVQSQNVGPFSSATVIPDITVAFNAVAVSLYGSVVDCNNVPVTNGYVYYNGNHSYLSGGNFNVMVCTGASVDIQAFDIDNLTESGVATYTLGAASLNVGQIIACNSISEYIIWDVNGTDYSATSGFTAYEQGTFVGFGGDVPDYFSFNTDNFTGIGSYVVDGTNGNNLYITGSSVDSIGIASGNVTLNLTQHGTNPGDLIEGNFSGTIGTGGSSETISGNIHFFHP